MHDILVFAEGAGYNQPLQLAGTCHAMPCHATLHASEAACDAVVHFAWIPRSTLKGSMMCGALAYPDMRMRRLAASRISPRDAIGWTWQRGHRASLAIVQTIDNL